MEVEINVDYKNFSSRWVAGFSTRESNFFIYVQKSKNKSGLSVYLRFSIGQHSRDILLLESLVIFFSCGYVVNYTQRSVCEFLITKTDHIADNIIPFLINIPLEVQNILSILILKVH